ncbi:MAG: ABC transporter ATP-binding protein [Desulfobacteraceae bacterium]|nr:ABC transporter ATP-binding protein [Desulfobacteraceae bacterium]
MPPLIEVRNLKTVFDTDAGFVTAINGVNFNIPQEKTLGVVGESGCGKSITAMSIMGLIRPPGSIAAGEIIFHKNGSAVDLTKLNPKGAQMRAIRGNEIAMIFQEPMTSLNPVYTIGNQIAESIAQHQRLTGRDAWDKAIEMIQAVGIPSAAQRARDYPHQLSGGMRQRAMIAMALSCNPRLLIADEPTTALDVTIQAQVLKLINDLRQEYKAAIMFITHDLGVIAHMADEVIVMYLGRIVESAPVRDIFHDPRHPYTQGLMSSIPSLSTSRRRRLKTIHGVVPSLSEAGAGCGFESRCHKKKPECSREAPPLTEVAPGHMAACWQLNRDGAAVFDTDNEF